MIYDHIIDSLEASGILNNATLHICSVGSAFDKNVKNYKFEHLSTNTNLFEFPTLQQMWQHAKTCDGAILYLHTKGATRPNITVDNWRNMMLHFNVKRWQKALHYLHEYDAVGCNLQNSHGKKFFSGNFWWTTGKYLKTLPDPNLYQKSRIQAETWIGMNPMSRFYSLHGSGVNHYTTAYTDEKYINL